MDAGLASSVRRRLVAERPLCPEMPVPLFRFSVQEGSQRPEMDMIELPDMRTAKSEAVILAGNMLKDIDGAFWQDSHWRLEVTTEDGLVLLTIDVDGAQSPAVRAMI